MKATRASLTPKEREAMWQAQDGLCGCGCKQPLERGPRRVVAEHWATVALGNDKKPDHLRRKECADAKTYGLCGDISKIAKVKRIRKKLAGDVKPKKKIASPGFDKTRTRGFDGRVRDRT